MTFCFASANTKSLFNDTSCSPNQKSTTVVFYIKILIISVEGIVIRTFDIKFCLTLPHKPLLHLQYVINHATFRRYVTVLSSSEPMKIFLLINYMIMHVIMYVEHPRNTER